MKFRDFPPMQSALGDVSELIPMLHDAFEAGTDYGRWTVERLRDIFSDPAIPCDPWHFPHSVRICVKQYLARAGLHADDYKLDDVAMSGLRFAYNDWNIRIRKSTCNRSVPYLGRTRSIRAFCQQMLPDGLGEGAFSGRNLLIIWHTTPQGAYTGLSLVYVADDLETEHPRELWRVDFDATATLLRVPQKLQEDIEVLENMDLDMELEMGEEGEEQAQ